MERGAVRFEGPPANCSTDPISAAPAPGKEIRLVDDSGVVTGPDPESCWCAGSR